MTVSRPRAWKSSRVLVPTQSAESSAIALSQDDFGTRGSAGTFRFNAFALLALHQNANGLVQRGHICELACGAQDMRDAMYERERLDTMIDIAGNVTKLRA